MSLPGTPAGTVQACPNCQLGWLVQDDGPPVDHEGNYGYHCEAPNGGCGFTVKSPAYFPPGRRGPLSPPRHAERRYAGGALTVGSGRRGGVPNTWQAGEDIGSRGPVWIDDFATDRSNQYYIGGDPANGHPAFAGRLGPDGLDVSGETFAGFQPLAINDLDYLRVTWTAKVAAPRQPYMGVYMGAHWGWGGIWSAGSVADDSAWSQGELDLPDIFDPDIFYPAVDDELIVVMERGRDRGILTATLDGAEVLSYDITSQASPETGINMDAIAYVILRSIKVEAL